MLRVDGCQDPNYKKSFCNRKSAMVFSFFLVLEVKGTHRCMRAHTRIPIGVLLCPVQGCYSVVRVEENEDSVRAFNEC